MRTKIIPFPKDAPPGTVPTFRELIDRVYALENKVTSNASEGDAGIKGLGSTVQSLSVTTQNLATTTAGLVATTEDLQSRYLVADNGDFFYGSGALPANSTFYTFGTEMSVTIHSPGTHKQTVITYGASEITVDPGTAVDSVLGEVTFKFSTSGSYGSYVTRLFQGASVATLGSAVSGVRSFNLAEGDYTITAVTRAWCATGGSGAASVAFTQPYLMAEIVG